MDDCEHDWRRGPRREWWAYQAVCLKCWKHRLLRLSEAEKWPAWTDEDYWNNLDAIEGDRAPDLRRMRKEGRV